MPKKTTKASAHTRGQTTALILMLVASALAIGSCSNSWSERMDRENAAINAFIEQHGCSVANMNGRMVSTYRCEKPEVRYLPATEVARQALAAQPE